MRRPSPPIAAGNHGSESRRQAFTLIELVVVVVIISMLATLAVLSLRGAMDRYHLSRAAETIEMFDARARREARTGRMPVQATIERGRRRMLVEGPGARGTQARTRFQLPGSVEIKEIRLHRRVTVGSELEIEFGREGSSPTYAVKLQRRQMSRWLVVLGISGQIIALDNEREVDELLSL